jgi:hypothetical protein
LQDKFGTATGTSDARCQHKAVARFQHGSKRQLLYAVKFMRRPRSQSSELARH